MARQSILALVCLLVPAVLSQQDIVIGTASYYDPDPTSIGACHIPLDTYGSNFVAIGLQFWQQGICGRRIHIKDRVNGREGEGYITDFCNSQNCSVGSTTTVQYSLSLWESFYSGDLTPSQQLLLNTSWYFDDSPSSTTASSSSSSTLSFTSPASSGSSTMQSSIPGTSSNSSATSLPSSSSSGLSGGAMAGIAIGVIVGVALICIALFLCLRRRRRNNQVQNRSLQYRKPTRLYSNPDQRDKVGTTPEPLATTDAVHLEPTPSPDSGEKSAGRRVSVYRKPPPVYIPDEQEGDGKASPEREARDPFKNPEP